MTDKKTPAEKIAADIIELALTTRAEDAQKLLDHSTGLINEALTQAALDAVKKQKEDSNLSK